MSERKPIVGGNWKMNLHAADAEALIAGLADAGLPDSVETVVCPAFPYLAAAAKQLEGTGIMLGAQDVYYEANGAFTGEVSCSMLKDIGVQWVLTGHSERRHVIGETDVMVNAKTRAALDAGLSVILCIGEKIEQREANQTDAINAGQLAYGLAGVSAEDLSRVVIAYEPVWAIGTGKTASTEDAEKAHAAIRGVLANLYDQSAADAMRIQYGGSCKPGNAAELFSQPDIDGGLIGGAALKVADFKAIIEAAAGVATA
ncbi:triose-phosphate isomerase [Planctomycetales bacterium ZRK34]|nr:triose-phosphate isomerase [Planctomycetales bacterium ZRK34]